MHPSVSKHTRWSVVWVWIGIQNEWGRKILTTLGDGQPRNHDSLPGKSNRLSSIPNSPNWFSDPPSLLLNEYRVLFSGDKIRQGVMVTTHCYPTHRLWTRGTKLPLSPTPSSREQKKLDILGKDWWVEQNNSRCRRKYFITKQKGICRNRSLELSKLTLLVASNRVPNYGAQDAPTANTNYDAAKWHLE
jgi:hypothetical protein